MYLVLTGIGSGCTGGLSPMSTSPLSPQEIRAAAAVHKELGPEYGDAVIESFLERVDREISARVDARLGPVSREQPVQPAQPNSRRALLTGVAIGIIVTGLPAVIVAARGGESGGAIAGKDEIQLLVVLAILWVIAVATAGFTYYRSYYRRTELSGRQAGRQTPRTSL
jgi:hypothetical protein